MRIVFDTPFPDAAMEAKDQLRFFRVQGLEFTGIRPVTEAEWVSYSEGLRVATAYHVCDELLVASETNYRDFTDTYVDLHESRTTSKAAEMRAAELAAALNRKLANYLSSFRLYLDVMQARLNRQYGTTSGEYTSFRAACKHEFDTYFAYRFAYRLRNYAQHLGMPIGHMRTLVRQAVAKGPVEHSIEISFKTQELLENGGDLWGPVQKDLEQAPELLPVVNVFGDFTLHLRRIRNATLAVEKPALEAVRSRVSRLLECLPPGRGVPRIGRYIAENGSWGIDLVPSVDDLLRSLPEAAL